MKVMIHNFIRTIIMCSMLLLSSTLSWGSSTTPVERLIHNGAHLYNRGANQNAPMAKILTVLGSRVGDQRLLEKAKDKLALMDEDEIRLIMSLCERVSGDKGTPDADIAFLLVTALIVLS